MPRAGSPSYWVPCLAAPPSGCRIKPGFQPRRTRKGPQTGNPTGKLPQILPISHSGSTANRTPPGALPAALLHPQEGEETLGIAQFRCCEGKSYSGLIQLTPTVTVNAIHCNGRHPSIVNDGQLVIWMMTNTPLAHPENFKLLLREGIEKLCPPGIVAREYNALQFATATGELGTQGR